MLKDLPLEDQYTLFLGLRKMVETDSYQGIFFLDGNACHPSYQAGAHGEELPAGHDLPYSNRLFYLMSELSRNLKDQSTHFSAWIDVTAWQKFCQYIVKATVKREEANCEHPDQASIFLGQPVQTG